MAHDNAQRVFPRRAGIKHILALFHRQGFCAHQPRHVHPRQQADDQNDVIHARLEVSIHHQQQEEGRNGHQDIHGAHHQVIQPAAKIAAHRSHHRADKRGKEHGEKTDHQGDLAAIQRAGEVVASVLVGAEPVRGIR